MKKLTALLLALCLLFALCACSSSGENSAEEATGPDPAEETEAVEETDEGNGEALEAPAAEYPEMTLNVSLGYQQTEAIGQAVSVFFDYITEKSGGNIQFNVYWGGTFCSTTEDLDFIRNGSVDMAIISQAENSAALPLSNFPAFVYGDQQTANDYWKYIMYENEETSALLEEEWTANNIHPLMVFPSGASAYITKTEISSYKDLAGMVIGSVVDIATLQEIGASVTVLAPPDTYESLQKGIIDGTYMSLDGAVAMNWYEVGPYFLLTGQYNCGNYLSINLDKWNAMDEATRALFTEAGEYAWDAATVQFDDAVQSNIDLIDSYNAEHGIDYKIAAQSEEDAAGWFAISSLSTAAECRTLADNAGVSEQMETILAACGEYLGVEY